MFRHLIPALADSYHLIAPDLLGSGLSDAPPVEEFDYTFDAYPALHEYLRDRRPPLLAVWGHGDEIFGPDGANAFAADVPDAEIHLLDGGHFLLESAGDQVADLIRDFMGRVTAAR